VVQLGGHTATVVALAARPGAADYYNLTVSQLHTYAVGTGQFVVHNCGSGLTSDDPHKVSLSRSKYPETAQHIDDAIAHGQPDVVQWDPAGATANRRASLSGHPTKSGYDRDEWPMAATQQGGAGADIEYINPSDNRGAGSIIAAYMRNLPNR